MLDEETESLLASVQILSELVKIFSGTRMELIVKVAMWLWVGSCSKKVWKLISRLLVTHWRGQNKEMYPVEKDFLRKGSSKSLHSSPKWNPLSTLSLNSCAQFSLKFSSSLCKTEVWILYSTSIFFPSSISSILIFE